MRQSKDEYFLSILKLVASRSTCPRRSVGAIIVNRKYHILSTGYNGVPTGFRHCNEYPCGGQDDPSGDSSNCLSVHAEVNAMLQCKSISEAHIMYVSCTPCFSCAKMICNTPIKVLIVAEDYADLRGRRTLEQAGIKVVVHNP